MILSYASRTGSGRTLKALREHGWRILVSATGIHRTEGFPYAVDNGAWTAFNQKRPFDEVVFATVLKKLGRGADWVVVPDIVEGGLKSLEFSLSWLPRVLEHSGRALIAVQDGMSESDVSHLLGPYVGLFVGGSTDWKLRTMSAWGLLSRARGCWLHIGRVNSERRIALCALAGAHSFDGTSATKFSVNIPRLTRARRRFSCTDWSLFQHLGGHHASRDHL